MKQLIIMPTDFYQIGQINYFKFNIGNKCCRDINSDLSKIDKYMLEIICKHCELDYKGLKKNQLVDLITNSGCLVINHN